MSDRLPLWRRLRRQGWYLAAVAVIALVRFLPRRSGRSFCRGLVRLGYRIRRRERALAGANLALVFADRCESWRQGLLRRNADALGENLYAALTSGRQAARGFPDVVVELDAEGRGLPDVLRQLQAKGRGVLLLTAHLGCWELLGVWLAGQVDCPTVVTATIHNPAVDRLLQDRRRTAGLRPLPREAGVKPLLRALDQGAVVGVLLDQATRAAAAVLPFLGRPARTPLVAYRIAWRRAVPLVPAAMVRANGRWLVRHLAPIFPQPGEDVLELAARGNRALETMIERNPAQWVWFHDRWDLRREGWRS